MRLVHRDFERDGGGSLVLIPEESEDMWHIYNLLMEGDHVRASTIRYLHKWHHVWPCACAYFSVPRALSKTRFLRKKSCRS